MAVAMAAETASADANSAANVTNSIRPLMRERTVPSFCAIWRICSAWECGIASCNWYAIEATYGEQYQRSNISGFIDLGSRRDNASSGLVSALT